MAKKTIMLVCSARMSTSMLVQRMQEAAKKKGLDAEIFAVGAGSAEEHIHSQKIDVLLLGAQIRYMKSDFEKRFGSKNIPIDVIQMTDYGTMNGEKVLSFAESLIKE